jgi:hypothetical protein
MNLINLLNELVNIVGVFTTVFAICLFIWTVLSWMLGVYPLFLRLGFGRWTRKIAIVANDNFYSTLKTDLVDTGVFREKNIYQIKADTLSKVKEISLALVHYQSFTEDQIKTVLSNKKSNAGFIFYFPEFTPPSVVIPPEMMKAINNQQFTTIVNMRGRLINDIVITLLSTSYDKR